LRGLRGLGYILPNQRKAGKRKENQSCHLCFVAVANNPKRKKTIVGADVRRVFNVGFHLLLSEVYARLLAVKKISHNAANATSRKGV
jgi:hypothetical protein